MPRDSIQGVALRNRGSHWLVIKQSYIAVNTGDASRLYGRSFCLNSATGNTEIEISRPRIPRNSSSRTPKVTWQQDRRIFRQGFQ
jgi:hypothetical protein